MVKYPNNAGFRLRRILRSLVLPDVWYYLHIHKNSKSFIVDVFEIELPRKRFFMSETKTTLNETTDSAVMILCRLCQN